MTAPHREEAETKKRAQMPLLLEIGCEEIPARFLTQAQMDFGDRVKAALEEARLIPQELSALSPGKREGAPGSALAEREGAPGEGVRQDKFPVQTYSTPRRLVAYVPAILERQADKVEEVTGPPIKVAVDATGKYTRAAESFAQKNSATVADLTRITTPKGEYLAVKKTTTGRTASEVLGEILPAVITGLSFPKSMYWTRKSGPRFVRPIRWIVALLGEENDVRVVPFEVAGVKAANFTFGHRTMGREPLAVSGFKDYLQKLHQSKVELKPQKRREWLQLVLHYLPGAKNLEVITEVTRAFRAPIEGTDADQRLEALRARVKGLPEVSDMRVVEDKGLEEWVVNSTEWPRALLGTFEERFLKLPREILVTVMRDHQKYFAVEDVKGNLRPHFVASLNREGDPQGLIKRGHERVLTARFSDAEFFWNADQKVTLAERLEKGWLERVTYQAKLGTYADKVRRMEVIAEEICRTLEISAVESVHVLRAVQLCKCDLTTQMVQEFTELQGVVGGLYAAAQGEPHEVADAIYDHYLPQGSQDNCPRSLAGAVVSLTDKIDSLAAGFTAGLEPTGSSDPFGLRRAGNGVVRLLVEFDMTISLRQCFGSQLRSVEDGVVAQLHQFLEERVHYYLETERRFRYDTVRAVLGRRPANEPAQLPWESPLAAFKLAKALEEMRGTENFEALVSAAKRIRNILKKSATGLDWQSGRISNDLLVEPEEKRLSSSREAAFWVVSELGIYGQYRDALNKIANLRPEVDQFFDKVLIMAEDRALRQNRLRLLESLDQIFSCIADLSQIESSTSIPVGASTSKE